jgi:glycosyltransferase involved in cell wall biosynthesis
VTTVPQTLKYILENQPRFLNVNYDVSIITSSGSDVSFIEAREGVKVRVVDMKRKPSIFSDLISLYRLTRVFFKIKPDIVHSYTPKAGLLTMIAAAFVGVRVRIHTFTGLIFPSRKGFSRALLITTDKLTSYCATVVVAESQGVRDDLEAVSVPCNDIRVIGSGNIAGVDESFFTPASLDVKNSERKNLGIPAEAFVFCYVGRLNPEKGISELLGAFQELSGNIFLILAGGVDKSHSLSDNDLNMIRAHPKILPLGQIDDVRRVFSASDVNILVSYREGFPNVLLESFSMGIPSIATNVNGSREVVINDKTGWLVPAKSKNAVAEAMLNSMSKEVDLKELGVNCRQLILDQFTRGAYLQELKCFYENLDVRS